MPNNVAERAIVEKGMHTLIDSLGVTDAERFISIMNRERKNYDKWREEYFVEMKPGEYEKELLAFAKKHE